MKRRTWLKAAAAGLGGAMVPTALVAQKAGEVASALNTVRITDVRTATIRLGNYDTVLVKVLTDSGLEGLGETYPRSAGADGAPDVHFIKQAVVGEDPLQVEYLVNRMLNHGKRSSSRTGSMTGAIAGVETALWDLAGKILGVPVWALLGGKYHDRLLIYHDTSPPSDYLDPAAWHDIAEETVEYGFRAIKFDFSHRSGPWNRAISNRELNGWVRVVEKTREYLGDDYPFGIDLKYKNSVPDALRFCEAMRPFNLWFIEDPLPPLNVSATRKVTEQSPVPIMTGEHFHSRQTWRELIETQASDYIHVDTQKCGGLLETKRIADWADLYYMPMACHNLCTPVGTIASAHACAAIKSCFTLESDSINHPFWADIIERDAGEKFYRDGYLEVPDKPGLGVELNEDTCQQNLAPGSEFFA